MKNCNNVPILSINWTAGFSLSNRENFDSPAFRTFLALREKHNVNIPIALHGFWLKLGRNGKIVRRPDKSFKIDYYRAAEDDLLAYFQLKPQRLSYVDMYWPDYRYWSPMAWHSEPLQVNWVSKANHFKIIVEEFLRHGKPLKLNISEYVELTIQEFEKLLLLQTLNRSRHFPSVTGKRFSIQSRIRFTWSFFLQSDIRNAVGKRPLLVFSKYKFRNATFCCLCEFKFAFTLTYDKQGARFVLDDQLSHTECKSHCGLPMNTSHQCVVLSHYNRCTLPH
ncbi:hypothetical protein OROMI_015595 [Orobanche minor]